jgi:hypothetical protein
MAARLRDRRHTGVLGIPFRRYQPCFDAYLSVAARAQERRADRRAGALAGTRALADALLRIRILEQGLKHRYWPSIRRRLVSSPEPAGSPFVGMKAALPELMSLGEKQASVDLALASPEMLTDTHPRLRDRLEALGEAPRVPPTADPTASEVLLGAARDGLAAKLDVLWARRMAKLWTKARELLKREAPKLARADDEGGSASQDATREIELARVREYVHGLEAALPHYRAILDAYPDNSAARLALARALLETGREEGLDVLGPLFDGPPDSASAAHELACEFHRREGRGAEACRHLKLAQGG